MSDRRVDDRNLPYVALLDRPLIRASSERGLFERVRRELEAVSLWFRTHTDWIVLESAEYIRLVKTPARPWPTHGFPFATSTRDYECVARVLWYGEKTGRDWFALSECATDIEQQAHLDSSAGGTSPFSVDLRSDRASLCRALLGMEGLGLLTRIDGDVEQYEADQRREALFAFTPAVARAIVRLPDAIYDGLVVAREMACVSAPLEDCLDRPDVRLMRALLLQPVVHEFEDPEAFAILHRRDRRDAIHAALRTAFGWSLEVAGRYACVLRETFDVGQILVFPTQSSVTHAVLCLAAHLREEVAAARLPIDVDTDGLLLSPVRLAAELEATASRHRGAWAAGLANLDSETFVATVTDTLRAWGFLSGPTEVGDYRISPALGRFACTYNDGPSSLSDFDDGSAAPSHPAWALSAAASPSVMSVSHVD